MSRRAEPLTLDVVILIAMLVGAAFLVLGQIGAWPPETALQRAPTGPTIAAVLIVVALTLHAVLANRR